ncbi:MAG TPA: head maturation protease, ClpP-related [Mycobacterium sp.]|nr:head maturation protease, ClpP-related [Mycobacterium sp.]
MPAIAAHHTATVDETWDGPAAVAAMPAEYADLHYCHGWEIPEAAASSHTPGDDDEDDQKSSFKFPMHKTKGGPANIRACRNALARVANSSIPDGDKAGVRRHAQTHLDDANKKSGNSTSLRLSTRVRNLLREAHALSYGAERTWYTLVRNDTGDSTMYVFGPIGGWFGVNSEDFAAELAQVKGALTVHINSGGGSAYEGIAIANLLRQHPHTVNGIVTGLAASAASVIAMGCDSLTMAPGSQLMIHRATTEVYGNRADMAEAMDFLEKMDTSLAGLYQARAGGDLDQWENAMQAETWYTPDEALAAGLADHIAEPPSKAGTDEPASWNTANVGGPGDPSTPVSPAVAVPPVAPAAPVPPVGVEIKPTPVQIDVEAVQAALRGMSTIPKEARS